MSKIDSFLKYGVSNEIATKIVNCGLSLTSFKNTSKNNLKSKYGLQSNEIDFVLKQIKRNPIEEDVLFLLLERSNYSCCTCKGTKSDSYIIHHIEHYSNTQDNSYENLAVLCPNCHDLAHKEGYSLTNKITPKQIKRSKKKWETEVEEIRVEKAAIDGNVGEIDFLNIPRIIELSMNLFGKVPETQYSTSLRIRDLIDENGFLNYKSDILKQNKNTPLIFFGPNGSWELKLHFIEILKKILKKVEFVDLDKLLKKRKIKEGIVGLFCYYVGGVYGKKTDYPINVDFIEINGKEYIKIDIRPYAFGFPKEKKNRIPDIVFQKKYDDFFEEE